MKKIVMYLLLLCMVLLLAGCGGNAVDSPTAEAVQETAEKNVTATEREDENRVLVAYFSATNVTEGVAESIADAMHASLYEIVPEEPYTEEDLNYDQENSRSTIEMKDSTARPAISGSVENMEQYHIIFLGYPIWWGEAPRILDTFVESYDFSGKIIVPFCTSASSGLGSSASQLESLTEGAQWLAGQRFSGNSSREEIEQWLNGLDFSTDEK